MSEKTERPWCPRCDQGEIHHILIHPLKVEGFLCDECNAFWFTQALIRQETFIPLETFLDVHGLTDIPENYDDIE